MKKEEPMVWSERLLIMSQIKQKEHKILALEDRIRTTEYLHEKDSQLINEQRLKIHTLSEKIKNLKSKCKPKKPSR